MTERLTAAQYRASLAAKGPAANPRNKYGAKSTRVDDHYFPSLLEARRYTQLKLLARAGLIRSLQLQRRFNLSAAGEKVAEYRVDFYYEELHKAGDWHPVAEDAKGFATPLYTLKKALFIRLYPHIEFREVRR